MWCLQPPQTFILNGARVRLEVPFKYETKPSRNLSFDILMCWCVRLSFFNTPSLHGPADHVFKKKTMNKPVLMRKAPATLFIQSIKHGVNTA